MKQIMSVLALFFLGACTTTPPAWWNPTSRYSSTTPASHPAKNQPQLFEEDMTPQEESIAPSAEGYEEMNLAPLQDIAQTHSSPSASPQSTTKTATAPSSDWPDDALPPPSILE